MLRLDRTTDTSLMEQGSTTISARAATTPKRAPPPVTPRTTHSMRTTGRGTGGPGRGGVGRGGTRGVRGSGLARPRGRGLR